MTRLHSLYFSATFFTSNNLHLSLSILLCGALLPGIPVMLHAQSLTFAGATPSVNFGNVNLCAAAKTTPAPCSKALTLTYNVTQGGKLGAPSVVTQGLPNLDFTLATGSTCTGNVTQGTTCTVNATFAPKFAGVRAGGLLITDSSGKVLAATLIYGNGVGPQIGFIPAAPVVLPALSTLAGYSVLAVDDGGDVFVLNGTAPPPTYIEQYNLLEFPANGGPPVTVYVGDYQHETYSIAIDGVGDLFLVIGNPNPFENEYASVYEVPVGGGAPILRLPGGFLTLNQVRVDALGNLFLTDDYNDLFELAAGASAATQLPFNNRSSHPAGFAMDGLGDLFVGEYFGKTEVVKVPEIGGTGTTLPLTTAGAAAMTADKLGNVFVGTNVSAPTSQTNEVSELPAGATTPVSLLSVTNSQPNTSLHFDSISVDAAGNPFVATDLFDYSGVVYTTTYTLTKLQNSQSSPLTFPTTPFGNSSTLPLLIHNTGNGTLSATASFNTSNYTLSSSSPEGCLAAIAPAQSCTLEIAFAPSAVGAQNGLLTLETNTAANPAVVVNLDSEGGGVAPPVFSLASGVYTTARSVSISDPTSGAAVYYTLDGTLPSASSTLYKGAISITASERLTAIAILPKVAPSAITTAAYTIVPATPANTINFGTGFAHAGGALQLNGRTALSGSALQLTNTGSYEAGSAFSATPVNIQSFATDFTFQLTNAVADGFVFTIQNVAATALGDAGGSLGYGGLGKSVAIKFDLYNNAGEGIDSTGLYEDGAQPTIPAIDLSGAALDLHSGDIFLAQITYDGAKLNVTLTDTSNLLSWSHSFAIDIPAVVGGDSAFVGFTGATGGSTADQEILSWTYAAGTPGPSIPPIPPPAIPNFSAGFDALGMTINGNALHAGTSLRLTDGGGSEAASAFYSTPLNIQSFDAYFTFGLSTTGNSGDGAEGADGITFTIQNAGVNTLGGFGGSLGYGGIGKSVAIKFDTHNNAGEGPNSTGLYIDGESPTVPSIDLDFTGIQLLYYETSDPIQAHLYYDGTNLALTLTDEVYGNTWSHTFTIDIPATVGSNTAFVGFTGATGALTSTQDILNWTFTNP
jgi:hypothetical protein